MADLGLMQSQPQASLNGWTAGPRDIGDQSSRAKEPFVLHQGGNKGGMSGGPSPPFLNTMTAGGNTLAEFLLVRTSQQRGWGVGGCMCVGMAVEPTQ